MLLASAIAVVAVALGLGLGLVPGGRARIAGPLRTFALSAALAVVLLHLMPEAFAELGPLALVLIAATSVVPAWVRLGRAFFGAGHDAGHAHGGLVAGYVGLLVHHVGDGLGLGAYAALPGGAERHADVMLALAVHTVPLVAVVAFAFQRSGGQRAAFRAASGLAAASVLGVVLSSVVPGELVERGTAWIAALVAGLLVHVVTHDLERDLPTNLSGRVVDALAAVLGAATTLFGGEHSLASHAITFVEIGATVVGNLSLPVVFGLVLAALLAHSRKMPFRAAFEAAFGPTLAVNGLVLAIWLGGAVWGVLYAAGAMLVARAVAAFPNESEPPKTTPAPEPAFLNRLDDCVSESLPWIAAAFAFYTLLWSSFPPGALDVLPAYAALALSVVVALPIRIPAAAAIIVAAALEHAGLRFEAALIFALLAPAPGAAELATLARRQTATVAARVAGAVALSALAVGVAAWLGAKFFESYDKPPFPGLSSRLAFLVLAALGVRAAFERGVRGFLLPVFPSHDTVSHAENPDESPAAPAKGDVSRATG